MKIEEHHNEGHKEHFKYPKVNMNRMRALLLLYVVIILLMSGCKEEPVVMAPITSESDTDVDNTSVVELTKESNSAEVSTADSADNTTEAENSNVPIGINYQTVKPDESKEIMVIMYHNLSEKNTSYGRTIESFKSDLQRLYDMGFRTISMTDYISNNIEIEAGCTPVVLTFDDGHISNFRYIESNEGIKIDSDCVVAILDEFALQHPSFGKNAVFYLNYGNPFGQPKYLDQKMNYLNEQGYEIGNHTYNHDDLSLLSALEIQTAIGKNVKLFNERYNWLNLNTLSLPYGKRSKDESLIQLVEKGTFEDYDYENKSIVLVGWRPYYPIYHIKFDSKYINRVQSGDDEMQLTWWLDQYEEKPTKRFISDGNSNRISIPDTSLENIDPTKIVEKELYIYELETTE